jgi:cytidylate kinase
MQQQFAHKQGRIVTEGRDQGTVAFPYADIKFFLTADENERAKRRQIQLDEAGIKKSHNEILEAINERDLRDMSRKTGALKPADDAIIVDTTNLNIEQVVEKLLCEIQKKKLY